MKKVKTYSPCSKHSNTMVEDKDLGDWIAEDDYVALQIENEKLRIANKKLKQSVEDLEVSMLVVLHKEASKAT